MSATMVDLYVNFLVFPCFILFEKADLSELTHFLSFFRGIPRWLKFNYQLVFEGIAEENINIKPFKFQ